MIKDVPKGARAIDLWLPVASDTDGQRVTRTKVNWPNGGMIATEPKYGNRIYHVRFEAPFDNLIKSEKLGAELSYDIERTEIVVPEAKEVAQSAPQKDPKDFFPYLQPNSLIPITGRIETIAQGLNLENDGPILAARKIYDYLIDEMTYDWQADGAGEGDVLWACDSKTGDCTDYHSMFLALCRNRGIPADHEFGFPIRSPRESGRIPSYHCWGRFYVEGVGWIPIDASEADKHPELRAYNFGSQADNLMKFTHGRDVVLEPPQQGPPINYFIHPYVEIDGKKHDGIDYTVRYKNLTAQNDSD